MIELVDFNEIYGKTVAKAAEPAKKTRRGRTTKKAAETTVETAEVVAEETTPSTEEKSAE